jgi:hypothetical protein
MECRICLDVCKEPRSLPCGHWFCTTCITTLIDKSKYPTKFNCPSCRLEVPRPSEGVENFPVAFITNKLDEAVKCQRKMQPKKQETFPDHKKPQEAYCDTCQKKLCIACMMAHDGHDKIL